MPNVSTNISMKIEKDAPKRERGITAPTHETHTTLDAFQSVLFVEIFGYKNSTGQRKYGKNLNKTKTVRNRR